MRTLYDHSCWRINVSDRGDIIFLIRGRDRFERVAEISFIERDKFVTSGWDHYERIVRALKDWFDNPVYIEKWLKMAEDGFVEPYGVWELIKGEFNLDSQFDCGESQV